MRRDSSGQSPGVPPQFNAAFLNDDDSDSGVSARLSDALQVFIMLC